VAFGPRLVEKRDLAVSGDVVGRDKRYNIFISIFGRAWSKGVATDPLDPEEDEEQANSDFLFSLIDRVEQRERFLSVWPRIVKVVPCLATGH